MAAARPGTDLDAWRTYLSRPEVRVVTLTVTEAAYLRAPHGGPDVDRADLRADLTALRAGPAAPVTTVPARLVAGLAARRDADAGPLTVVPCDNLPDNGAVTARVVTELADLVDDGLAGGDAVVAAAAGPPAEAVRRAATLLDADLAGDDALLAEVANTLGER